MKLNLKKISVLIMLLAINKMAFAQSKSLLRFGISINPTISNAIITGNDSAAKSFISAEKNNIVFKHTSGATIWMKYLVKRKLDLMLGIGLSNKGFQRKQENLKFNQPTYPGIGTGKIEDLSNSNKSLFYNYNFNYINIPILFNWYLGSNANYTFNFAITAGADMAFLINHNMVAYTATGFKIDGNEKFTLDSSGFAANRFLGSINLGCRAEYALSKKLDAFLLPVINISPISLTSNAYNAIPYNLIINAGVTYAIKK